MNLEEFILKFNVFIAMLIITFLLGWYLMRAIDTALNL